MNGSDREPGTGDRPDGSRAGVDSPAGTGAGRAEPRAAAAELDLVRRILVPEREEIGRVARKVDTWRVTAADLAPVLPQALAEEARRGTLGRALQPTVEDAIEASVRKRPQRIVDAIFPIIGPAIRKSVAEALRSMTETLNRVLEQSLSLRSIGWRIEAARSGRPFAEIALAKSLVWRVEHVFLVHRETGLCMARASSDGLGVLDGDAVSGMLVALQDYVRTSFADPDPEAGAAELSDVAVGERVVWVERGSSAALAAVVRGSPPPELRGVLQDTLAQIHAVSGERLAAWRGDPDPEIEALSEYLEDDLLAQERASGSPGRGRAVLVLGLFALALVPLFAYFRGRGLRQEWQACRAALTREPGIVILSQETGGGQLTLELLRDPLARPVEQVLAEVADPTTIVRYRTHPFQSLDPAIVLARARALLRPPPGVTLELEGGVLTARALAQDAWLDQARARAAFLPGVETFQVRIDSGEAR